MKVDDISVAIMIYWDKLQILTKPILGRIERLSD